MAHQVAGAVQACAGSGEGVSDKTLCAQSRALVIAARHTFAADIQLTGHSIRHGIEGIVQHIESTFSDTLADRRINRATHGVYRDFPQQWGHHGFSRTVTVSQVLRLEGTLDQFEVGVGHRITAKAVDAYRWRRLLLSLGELCELLQIGWREASDANGMLVQRVPGFFCGPQAIVAHH